jgi:hypothetical protein
MERTSAAASPMAAAPVTSSTQEEPLSLSLSLSLSLRVEVCPPNSLPRDWTYYLLLLLLLLLPQCCFTVFSQFAYCSIIVGFPDAINTAASLNSCAISTLQISSLGGSNAFERKHHQTRCELMWLDIRKRSVCRLFTRAQKFSLSFRHLSPK